MISLVPAILLAFFSFLCSVFVILHIVIPILPPSPLSKRVSPAEFGLPKFRPLSAADKGHIWLASLDIVALVIFVWQEINEATGGPSDLASASDPASAVRMWLVMTVRQTCLLIVASFTLLHVRMGRPVSFGAKHWMLWAPTGLLVITSTSIAGVLSGAGLQSLFIGIISYTSTVSILSSMSFTCLVVTLVAIKRNLAALNEELDPWPPSKMTEERPRASFATEDIDAIREGASWITSNASSRRDSISAWSFSTLQTSAPSSHHGYGSSRTHKGFDAGVSAKPSFWFGAPSPIINDVPPVPPLPPPYGSVSSTAHSFSEPDLFQRETPLSFPQQPRVRLDSQTSWLTSTNGSHTTMSAWSYPTSVREGRIHNASAPDLCSTLTAVSPRSHPVKPRLASAQVLGGYGFTPGAYEVEKGLGTSAAPPGTTVDISMFRLLGWLLYILVPFVLSLPYLITVPQRSSVSTAVSVVFTLSVTMSSPILVIIILFRSPIPIPSGLFDVLEPHGNVARAISPVSTYAQFRWSQDYKRSTSTSPTVVEGRRSGDVWITNGDAVEGKGKVGRAMGMLSPMPKLSVLPQEAENDRPRTPPLPIQNEDFSLPINLHCRSHSETSTQFDRLRKDSMASSRLSETRESYTYAGKVMIAQRHYSALAQTVVVTGPFSEKNQSAKADQVFGSATSVTSANVTRQSIHLRNRSVSSISDPQTPTSNASLIATPPPTIPLPPTPPRIEVARLASLTHKKCLSSGYTFGPVDDVNEIDALTAGVLPLLAPGINVHGIKIKEGDCIPPGTSRESRSRKPAKKLADFGGEFSSPEVHSTPFRHCALERTPRKTFTHKRNRYSLPSSFGLGKDDTQSLSRWGVEVRGALETETTEYQTTSDVESGRRNTIFGGESMLKTIPYYGTKHLIEAYPQGAAELKRAKSSRFLGLRVDVPHGLDTPRESVSSMAPPFSAASTVTLFEEFVLGLEEDPEAQSTPHNIATNKPISKHPGVPLNLPKEKRRSNMMHVKLDDHRDAKPTIPNADTMTASSAISALTQWSTWAVRPLISNTSKKSNTDSSQSGSKPGSPGGNLRPLTLLQDCDKSIPVSPVFDSIRPLTLWKRQKPRGSPPVQTENAGPDFTSSSRSKNLKPLRLVPSDTSRIRGDLRKDGVIANVVVRPPFASGHADSSLERD
ncbi:hypothetical protein H2248_006661 [Termitomyces sp. 'cryptogamus']|nr:hypothetical protein H2248_006661 [Termitomyces sp. 'cryptogamus']